MCSESNWHASCDTLKANGLESVHVVQALTIMSNASELFVILKSTQGTRACVLRLVCEDENAEDVLDAYAERLEALIARKETTCLEALHQKGLGCTVIVMYDSE